MTNPGPTLFGSLNARFIERVIHYRGVAQGRAAVSCPIRVRLKGCTATGIQGETHEDHR